MNPGVRFFIIILSFVVLAVVINFIRKKKLRVDYAILWVITGLVLIILPLINNYLDRFAYSIGVYYPPALIYVFAILFIIMILLDFSIRISKLSEQNKNLIQDLGILREKVKEMEKKER